MSAGQHTLGDVASRKHGYAGGHRRRKLAKILARKPASVGPLHTWTVQPGMVVAVQPDLAVTIETPGEPQEVANMAGLFVALGLAEEYRDLAARTVIASLRS